MTSDEPIKSAQNPKIKSALALRDKRARDGEKLFLIEGFRELMRAEAGGIHFQTLFFCPDFFLGKNEAELIDKIKASGCHVYACAPHIFEKLSYRDRPDGLLGIAHQMQRGLKDLMPKILKNEHPFFLVAEAIEKPGNLGSMLRSADAVGVDGVIVCDRCTDIYNPNVVRASVGTLFTQPVVEAAGGETLFFLREKKVKIVAATPSAKQEYTRVDLSGPVAIVVGTEQVGLTDPWLHASDVQVRIPMCGTADSLNVATAATLLLYEVLRQRRSFNSL